MKYLIVAGALVSWAALLSYFAVVVDWPTLRDMGWPNVLVGGVGLLLATVGVIGLLRGGTSWWQGTAFGLVAVLSVLPAVFLAAYVLYLSYQMPPGNRALAVGQEAPEFRLRDAEGAEIALSELLVADRDPATRWIVVDFFRGPW